MTHATQIASTSPGDRDGEFSARFFTLKDTSQTPASAILFNLVIVMTLFDIIFINTFQGNGQDSSYKSSRLTELGLFGKRRQNKLL